MSDITVELPYRLPQEKLPRRGRLRMRYKPLELPVPHWIIDRDLYTRPDFAPPPPVRGFWLQAELPRVKLRGLSPADSMILRHAIAINMIDPAQFYLAPLIPDQTVSLITDPITDDSRDLLSCEHPPWQPDGWLPLPGEERFY